MSLPETELTIENDRADVEGVSVAKTPDKHFSVSAVSLRTWGLRSALSLTDQGLTSGAGFLVNLLLARMLRTEAYGAFAVAFTGYLFISGFHNVLLLEPMSVIGPSRHADDLPQYFRAQLAIHFLLTVALSAVALIAAAVVWRLAPGSPLSGAVLGAGLALPFLLLAWLARRMCYAVQRPSVALIGSGFYVSFVIAGLFALGHFGKLGSFTAFVLMGVGSALAAGLLLWRLGLLRWVPNGATGFSWRAVLRENWVFGRWLVGSTLLYSISSQTQVFLVAGVLGLGAAGILRAMQIPSLVMTQVVFAAGLLVLPSFSYDFGKGSMQRLRHKAMLVSICLVGGVLTFAFILAIFAGQTERLLFGGRYAAYAHLMPILALIPAAIGFSTGYAMAIRASHRTHFDLVANAIAAPVGLISAVFFTRWWGIAGAAASMAVGFSAYAISVHRIYYLAPQITGNEVC
jgi:O-antigen/teichoic acid export membrane protein